MLTVKLSPLHAFKNIKNSLYGLIFLPILVVTVLILRKLYSELWEILVRRHGVFPLNTVTPIKVQIKEEFSVHFSSLCLWCLWHQLPCSASLSFPHSDALRDKVREAGGHWAVTQMPVTSQQTSFGSHDDIHSRTAASPRGAAGCCCGFLCHSPGSPYYRSSNLFLRM